MGFNIEKTYAINKKGIKAYFNTFSPYEVMISNGEEPKFFSKKEAEIILEFLNHLRCEGWLEG